MRPAALLSATVLAAALLSSPVAEAAGPGAPEELHYRWRLTKFLGVVAGIFLPHEGDGLLTLSAAAPGTLECKLMITSEKSRAGEHFLYGSEIESATGRALRAWSSYTWRGEKNSKSGQIDGADVVDIASGIYLLRRNPPDKPRMMEIWSDGKVYPVVVVPLGEESRRIAGKVVATEHLSVRGIERQGRPFFKGKLDLWLAKDDKATPVEILIDRRAAGVHLELSRYEPPGGRASSP